MDCKVIANLEMLVNHIPNLSNRYRAAGQLGLKKFSQEMLNDPESAYLKDTVFKNKLYT